MSNEPRDPESEKPLTGVPPEEKKPEPKAELPALDAKPAERPPPSPKVVPAPTSAAASPTAAPPVKTAPRVEPVAKAPAAVAAATAAPLKPAGDAAKKPPAKKEEEKPSRRELLTTSVALGAGWIAFGGATAISIGPALGRFLMPNVVEEPDPKVRVGLLSRYREMKPGEVNEDYKPQKIWIIREEERVAALSTTCTHLGCIPNWLPNDRKFKCPCHGSGFYPTGINFEGPAPRPLERFKVAVENGIVLVDRSRKFQQEMGQWELPDSYLKV